MLTPLSLMIVTATAFMAVVMTVTAALAERLKNAGIVDVVWAFGFIPLALTALWLGDGDMNRQLIMLALVILANGRLGIYLLRRAIQTHPTEDPRYHVLREEWGNTAGWKFWLLFLFQGLLMILLTIPYMLLALNPNSSINGTEWLGIGLWLLSILGESIADWQLSQFKAYHRGQVCNIGLWRYSRHPNYFFQWFQWVSIFIWASQSEYGIWTIYAPLLMLYFLTKVTGIAATEAQLLRSKGEAFKLYQQQTSAFFPWPPKK